jgi:hypothetical protein
MAKVLSLWDALLRCSTRQRNRWHHCKNSALCTTSYRRTYKNQNCFWFTSNTFLKRPILLEYWLLRPFSTRKPHAKAVPSKDYFTHMRTLIIAQRYDVPQEWLWDARHMAGVRWGSHCKGFCSKEGPHYRFEQSARNLTINLINKFGNPWVFHTWAVLHRLAGLMSHKKVSIWGFLWVRKVFAFARRMFTSETFGKRRKASCFEKLTCSVPEIWGRMYDVLPRSAKGTRNGTRNWIPMQPRKGAKKLVSSNFTKILEYESSN